MKLHRNIALALIVIFGLAVSVRANTVEKIADPTRWEKEILKFEETDKTNSPPEKANLFVGSSSIRGWKTLAQDFPKHKVINRGFGGSHLNDSVHYFDRIVAPYKPKMIFVYAGSNDIYFGKKPETVFADFKAFVEKTRKALPKTKVAFISIAPNPARWNLVEEFKQTNKLIEDYTKTDSKLIYIDVFNPMLGADAKPLPDIFVKDNLHMNPKGYLLWTKIVKPHLK